MIKAKNERKYPRIDLDSLNKVIDENVQFLPAELTTSTNDHYKCIIRDISQNGCRIAAPIQLKQEELIRIGFVVNKRTVINKAIVRWIIPQSHVSLMGLEFEEMPGSTKEFLWALTSIAMKGSEEIAKLKKALK